MSFIIEQQSLSIRDIQLAIEIYRPKSPVHTVIALHGWLDNAASFTLIAPHLANANIQVIAVDLAGQGLSDMRPLQASYHLWDDAVDVLAIANHLRLESFSLMGHSRGAMIATMLSVSLADSGRIQALINLDGLFPLPIEIKDDPEQFKRFVHGFQNRKASRQFNTREEAILVRAKAANMLPSAVEYLARRGLVENEDGFSWRIDERLKVASAMKQTAAHNQQWLLQLRQHVQQQSLRCRIIMAEQGLAQMPELVSCAQAYPEFDWQYFAGGHHQHMQQQADSIAQSCLQLLTF